MAEGSARHIMKFSNNMKTIVIAVHYMMTVITKTMIMTTQYFKLTQLL